MDPDCYQEMGPSYNATGIFSPTTTTEEDRASAISSLVFYQDLIEITGDSGLVTPCHMISNVVMAGLEQIESDLARVAPDRRQVRVIDNAATVVVRCAKSVLKTYQNHIVYQIPSIHNRTILEHLETFLKQAPSWEQKVSLKIEDISQLKTPVVIDATGIGRDKNYESVGHQTETPVRPFHLEAQGQQVLPCALNLRPRGTVRYPLGEAVSCLDFLHLSPHQSYQTWGGSYHNYRAMAEQLGISQNVFTDGHAFYVLQGLKTLWRRSAWLGLEMAKTFYAERIGEWGRTHLSEFPQLWQLPDPHETTFPSLRWGQ